MLLMLPMQLYIFELFFILIFHTRSATSSNKTSTAVVSQKVNCVSDECGLYYVLITRSFQRFVTRPHEFWRCVATAGIAVNLLPTDSHTPHVHTDPVDNRIPKTINNNTTRQFVISYGQDNCSVRNSGNPNIFKPYYNIKKCCWLFSGFETRILEVVVL
jgi:hypothetical protein